MALKKRLFTDDEIADLLDDAIVYKRGDTGTVGCGEGEGVLCASTVINREAFGIWSSNGTWYVIRLLLCMRRSNGTSVSSACNSANFNKRRSEHWIV